MIRKRPQGINPSFAPPDDQSHSLMNGFVHAEPMPLAVILTISFGYRWVDIDHVFHESDE